MKTQTEATCSNPVPGEQIKRLKPEFHPSPNLQPVLEDCNHEVLQWGKCRRCGKQIEEVKVTRQ